MRIFEYCKKMIHRISDFLQKIIVAYKLNIYLISFWGTLFFRFLDQKGPELGPK